MRWGFQCTTNGELDKSAELSDRLTEPAWGRDGAASGQIGCGNKSSARPIMDASEREARAFPIAHKPLHPWHGGA